MKHPNLTIKVVVLACSVLLVGGLISFQAGGFRWLKTTGPIADSPKPEKAAKKMPVFIYSSKSYLPDGFMSGLTPEGTFTPDKDANETKE